MATYTTKKGDNPYEGVGVGAHRGVNVGTMEVELPSTITTGDVVWLGWVPAGAVVVGPAFAKSDDLDTHTTPTAAFAIGDATTTTLFVATAATTTAAQGGGVVAGQTNVHFTKFAAATRLKLTMVTGAATPAAGTVLFGVPYFIDPEYNVTTGPGVVLD